MVYEQLFPKYDLGFRDGGIVRASPIQPAAIRGSRDSATVRQMQTEDPGKFSAIKEF